MSGEASSMKPAFLAGMKRLRADPSLQEVMVYCDEVHANGLLWVLRHGFNTRMISANLYLLFREEVLQIQYPQKGGSNEVGQADRN